MSINTVERVNSGESSHRDSRGIADEESLEIQIQNLNVHMRSLQARYAQLETRQAKISAEIKGNRLPPRLYQELNQEKAVIQTEKAKIAEEKRSAKDRLISLERDMREEKHRLDERGLFALVKKMYEEFQDLRKDVRELKQRAGMSK